MSVDSIIQHSFILSIKMPNNYTGSYTVTLTATDTFGQTSSFSFLFTISSWVQLGWDEWKGSGAADCTLCKSGYVFSSGSWTQTSSTNSSSSSSTNVFDYLNRDVKASSPEGIGAPIVASVTSTIAVNIVSGASSSISGFGIAQCQNIQTLSLINMNIPNNYRSTLCHFPPKKWRFYRFLWGGKWQRPTKIFIKFFWKFY